MKTTENIFAPYKTIILVAIAIMGFGHASGQTTAASGAWTTGANWVGGVAPVTSGQTSGTLTIAHNMTLTGNYSLGTDIIVNAGKTLSISGDLTLSGGAS